MIITGCQAIEKKANENNKNQKNENIFNINGYSMAPTLNNSDQVEVNFQYYQNNPIKRGDIVVVQFKTREDKFVKRVIAIPDDAVEVKNGKLVINENSISFSPAFNYQFSLLQKQLNRSNNTMPMKSYLILGDNVVNSFDSGEFGIIAEEQIIGRVLI